MVVRILASQAFFAELVKQARDSPKAPDKIRGAALPIVGELSLLTGRP